MSWFTDVLDFHRKFGQTIGRDYRVFPGPELIAFRLKLIKEELKELELALEAHDFLEVVDAICDLAYVTVGTAIAFGVDLRPVWKEVQATNMAKDGGGLRGDGKILKPAGWRPPDIARALVLGRVLK